MHTVTTIRDSAQLLDQLQGIMSGGLPDDQKKEKVRAIGRKIFETLRPISLNDGDLFRQADALKQATELTEYTDLGLVTETANIMQAILQGIDPTLVPPKETSTPTQYHGVSTQKAQLASIFLTQLHKIVSSEFSEEEKRAKLVASGKKIFDAICGANLPNGSELLSKAEALKSRVAHPDTTFAEIGELAKTMEAMLKVAQKPVSVPKRTTPAVTGDAAKLLQRPEVVRLIESYPPDTASKGRRIPLALTQAKQLAHRILDGVYGWEVQERLVNATLAPDAEDLFLFLLLDGILHGDAMTTEIFNDIPEELRSLKNRLSAEKIASVLIGESQKLSLPCGTLWTRFVSGVSKEHAHNNEVQAAIQTYMTTFLFPTLKQLLHIALEVPGDDVRELLRCVVETQDPARWEELETLLAIFDEKEDTQAAILAKDISAHPLFFELLAIMAESRPEFVIAMANTYASSGTVVAGAVRRAVLSVASDVKRAISIFGSITNAQLILIAVPPLIEAFRDTEPLIAITFVFSLSCSENALRDGAACFIRNKTAEEVVKQIKIAEETFPSLRTPALETWQKVRMALVSSVLIREAARDINETIRLFDEIIPMRTSDTTVSSAATGENATQRGTVLMQLAEHLGAHGTTSQLYQCLQHPSLSEQSDLLKMEFVAAALRHVHGIDAKEILTMINGIEDAQVLVLLWCRINNEFMAIDYLSLEPEDKIFVDALIGGKDSKTQDVMRGFCALGYARSGTDRAIQEAIDLTSHIQNALIHETVLLMITTELATLRPAPSQSHVSQYAEAILQQLDACAAKTRDTIRALLVVLLSESSHILEAMKIVQKIQSPKELAQAFGTLAGAIVAKHSASAHYLEYLQQLVALAEGPSEEMPPILKAVLQSLATADRSAEETELYLTTTLQAFFKNDEEKAKQVLTIVDRIKKARRCLSAILRPVAASDRKTALQLLEHVSENNREFAEMVIALAEQPSESASSSSSDSE